MQQWIRLAPLLYHCNHFIFVSLFLLEKAVDLSSYAPLAVGKSTEMMLH